MTPGNQASLPTVTWKGNTISRLLIGHNPFKAQSHHTKELDAEMREWYSSMDNCQEILKRCEECGINTAQFGAALMHDIMQEHKARGGGMQWIATFYGNQSGQLGRGDVMGLQEELDAILAVDPKPIGFQHFGEATDRHFFEGKLDQLKERMKWLRDTGLMIGICSHLPEVIEEINSQDWDIDFFQTCFYTVYSFIGGDRNNIDRDNETYEETDRQRMVKAIKNSSKPCIAFKVLGANRHCTTEETTRQALEFAFNNIKDTDVVCLGMWQKYKDQVGQNVEWAKEILGVKQ